MNEIAKPQTRRQHTRQATIAAILDAARVQMRAEGAAALSLNEVARQVGLRPPSLYEYFPGGKFAIYDALFRLGYEQCILMTEPFARIDDPWELLQAMAEFFFTFATANPDLYQLCFERPVPGFVPSDESLAVSFGVLNQFRAHMERVLAPLPNTTGLTIEQFFTLAIALMQGITTSHLANEPQLPLGQGRFGSLVPFYATTLRRIWAAEPSTTTSKGTAQ